MKSIARKDIFFPCKPQKLHFPSTICDSHKSEKWFSKPIKINRFVSYQILKYFKRSSAVAHNY